MGNEPGQAFFPVDLNYSLFPPALVEPGKESQLLWAVGLVSLEKLTPGSLLARGVDLMKKGLSISRQKRLSVQGSEGDRGQYLSSP
jgi:hypothetical protein